MNCCGWSILFIVKSLVQIYLFLAALDLCCCMWAFSGCRWAGAILYWGEQISHCGGFSCGRAQPLGHTGCSSHGIWLWCLWLVESSWTMDQIRVPCIGRWLPIYCAASEVQRWLFLFAEHVLRGTWAGLQ